MARENTVRGLGDAIESVTAAAAKSPGDRSRTSRKLSNALEDSRGRMEGEPAVRFRMRCPRRIVWLWREVVELARRMLRSDAPLWQVADAIAAEGAAELPPDANGIDPAPEGRIVSNESGCCESAPPPMPDRPAVPNAPGADLTAIEEGIERLDAFQLDGRMHLVTALMQGLDWQTGRLLGTFTRLRLHRVLGFGSVAEYVRERLPFSDRKARALLNVDRKSWEVPELVEAYRRGEISWLQALALLPVIGERNGTMWIARARLVTFRRLVAEVEWAIEMREVMAAEQQSVSLRRSCRLRRG